MTTKEGQASHETQLRQEGADHGVARHEPVDSLPPADFYDPVIEVYKEGIDRTLLRENLKLTVEERIRKAQRIHESIDQVRGIARTGTSVRSEGAKS